MTLIIVLGTIVFFIAGYYVMDRIDRFLSNNVMDVKKDNYINDNGIWESSLSEYILIFGDNELSSFIKNLCTENSIQYKSITKVNELDYRYKYSLLFALSDTDIDNLLISSVCTNICTVPFIVSLCNDRENIKVFKEYNLEKVIMKGDDINYSLNILKGMVNCATK